MPYSTRTGYIQTILHDIVRDGDFDMRTLMAIAFALAYTADRLADNADVRAEAGRIITNVLTREY